MKILIAYTPSTDSDNPFVRLLAEGLRTEGYEVTCSVERFWRDAVKYDIVHLQWPEELFGWKDPTKEELHRLKGIFNELAAHHIPVVYTRHNTRSHNGNSLTNKAYQIVESNATAVVHMGQYSLNEFTAKHPHRDQLQAVILHHIYDTLYHKLPDPTAARRALGIAQNRFVVLAFGAFRHDEERKLTIRAFRHLKQPHKLLLAPRLWAYTLRGSYYTGIKRLAAKLLYHAMHATEGLFRCRITSPDALIPAEALPNYFAAADVVFIQRTDILNSGNVPMAFLFGKVVVGPQSGNIGELLTQTGNPVFDPAERSSIDQAMQQAAQFARADRGAQNRAYAFEHLTLQQIARQYGALYHQLNERKDQ